MTSKAEHRADKPKRKRASKRAVRVWAWSLGALSFLSPLAYLGASPKAEAANPAGSASTTTAVPQSPKRPVVVVVTRRIIKRAAPKPVYTSSSSGGGGTTYVSAPVSAPAATSCGTHAC